jgi:hypothetical protein
MKCEICKQQIAETFLNKVIGTYVKDAKGKKHVICHDCQHALKTDKKAILEKLGK